MHIKSNYFHRKGLLMYKIKTLIISVIQTKLSVFSTQSRFWWLNIEKNQDSKSSGRIGTCSCQGRLCWWDASVGGSLAGVELPSPSLELWGISGGGPGKPRPPYGGGIMALWGGRCPGGKGRGGSPRGPKNSGGTSRSPSGGGGSGPNGGPRPDQTKRNTRFSDALKMNIQNHWTELWRLINFHIANWIKKQTIKVVLALFKGIVYSPSCRKTSVHLQKTNEGIFDEIWAFSDPP